MESTHAVGAKLVSLTPLHFALLSFLIVVPVFSGFDIASSSRFGLFLSFNTLCGQYVWSKLLNNRNPSIFESLAAGLAIGTSFPAVINIGIRLLGLTGFSTGLIFPIACIFGWLVFDRRTPTLSVSVNEQDDQDFRILLAVPLLAIVAWNPHTWLFCATYLLGTLLVWCFRRNSINRFGRPWSGAITAAILTFALILSRIYASQFLEKPIWRLFLGTDGAYDEGAAWSISTLGIRSNAFFYGHSLSGHFLTNSWAGDIAATIKLPRFFLTGSTGFAIGILGISLIVYVSSITLSNKRSIAVISSLFLVGQASLPEELMIVAAPRYANSISSFYLAFAFFFIAYLTKEAIKYQYLLFAYLILVVTLAKFHWGVIMVGAMCFTTLIGFVIHRRSDHFYLTLVSLISFTFVYFVFISGILNTEKIEFSFSSHYLLITVSLLAMRNINLLRIPNLDFQGPTPGNIMFAVAILSISAIWITNGRNMTTYFFSTAFIAAAMFGIPLVLEEIHSSVKVNKLFEIVAIGISVGLFTSIVPLYFRYRIAGVDRYNMLHWFFVENIVLVQPIIVLALLALRLIYQKLRIFHTELPKRSIAQFSFVFLLLAGINLGNWLVSPLKPTITRFWQDVNFQSDIAYTDEQFDIANWLNSNTADTSIVATNFSCPISVLSDSEMFSELQCLIRNTASWIVPLANRQALIESPAWFIGAPGSAQEKEINDLLGDIEDASFSNSTASFSKLMVRGVDYLVIDSRRSPRTSWLPNAKQVYSNNHYYVVKIQK